MKAPTNLIILNREIEEAKVRYLEAKRAYEDTIKRVQNVCGHGEHVILETPWETMRYSPPLRPMRVCTYCGRWEEERGYYEELQDRGNVISGIDREELYQYRRGEGV